MTSVSVGSGKFSGIFHNMSTDTGDKEFDVDDWDRGATVAHRVEALCSHPPRFACSRTGALMSDPVLAGDGRVYDRTAIDVSCHSVPFLKEDVEAFAVGRVREILGVTPRLKTCGFVNEVSQLLAYGTSLARTVSDDAASLKAVLELSVTLSCGVVDEARRELVQLLAERSEFSELVSRFQEFDVASVAPVLSYAQSCALCEKAREVASRGNEEPYRSTYVQCARLRLLKLESAEVELWTTTVSQLPSVVTWHAPLPKSRIRDALRREFVQELYEAAPSDDLCEDFAKLLVESPSTCCLGRTLESQPVEVLEAAARYARGSSTVPVDRVCSILLALARRLAPPAACEVYRQVLRMNEDCGSARAGLTKSHLDELRGGRVTSDMKVELVKLLQKVRDVETVADHFQVLRECVYPHSLDATFALDLADCLARRCRTRDAAAVAVSTAVQMEETGAIKEAAQVFTTAFALDQNNVAAEDGMKRLTVVTDRETETATQLFTAAEGHEAMSQVRVSEAMAFLGKHVSKVTEKAMERMDAKLLRLQRELGNRHDMLDAKMLDAIGRKAQTFEARAQELLLEMGARSTSSVQMIEGRMRCLEEETSSMGADAKSRDEKLNMLEHTMVSMSETLRVLDENLRRVKMDEPGGTTDHVTKRKLASFEQRLTVVNDAAQLTGETLARLETHSRNRDARANSTEDKLERLESALVSMTKSWQSNETEENPSSLEQKSCNLESDANLGIYEAQSATGQLSSLEQELVAMSGALQAMDQKLRRLETDAASRVATVPTQEELPIVACQLIQPPGAGHHCTLQSLLSLEERFEQASAAMTHSMGSAHEKLCRLETDANFRDKVLQSAVGTLQSLEEGLSLVSGAVPALDAKVRQLQVARTSDTEAHVEEHLQDIETRLVTMSGAMQALDQNFRDWDADASFRASEAQSAVEKLLSVEQRLASVSGAMDTVDQKLCRIESDATSRETMLEQERCLGSEAVQALGQKLRQIETTLCAKDQEEHLRGLERKLSAMNEGILVADQRFSKLELLLESEAQCTAEKFLTFEQELVAMTGTVQAIDQKMGVLKTDMVVPPHHSKEQLQKVERGLRLAMQSLDDKLLQLETTMCERDAKAQPREEHLVSLEEGLSKVIGSIWTIDQKLCHVENARELSVVSATVQTIDEKLQQLENSSCASDRSTRENLASLKEKFEQGLADMSHSLECCDQKLCLLETDVRSRDKVVHSAEAKLQSVEHEVSVVSRTMPALDEKVRQLDTRLVTTSEAMQVLELEVRKFESEACAARVAAETVEESLKELSTTVSCKDDKPYVQFKGLDAEGFNQTYYLDDQCLFTGRETYWTLSKDKVIYKNEVGWWCLATCNRDRNLIALYYTQDELLSKSARWRSIALGSLIHPHIAIHGNSRRNPLSLSIRL